MSEQTICKLCKKLILEGQETEQAGIFNKVTIHKSCSEIKRRRHQHAVNMYLATR